MRLSPPAVKLLSAIALPLVLTACGPTSTKSAAPAAQTAASSPAATKADASSPAATKAAGPNAGLLTGTQLKALLAPATFFPSGFDVDSAGSRDTGDTYTQPTAADVPTPDCTRLGGTSWTGITGITGVSFAQNDYVNKNTSAEIAQEIDVYQGATAQTVIGALGKLALACPSFADAQTSSKTKVTETPLAGLGDEAYTITVTDSAWQNGDTLIAARVGTSVVTVLANDGSDNGAATAKKLSSQLVSGLKAKA
ncbi:hypothetical protein GCM10018790_62830 [Kitasatospora xanthocidica]|uniref:hypothetical protein n=1 Tax=Kitasatospora xanthocidica TaxID=83382 RepID=UPI001677E527|nr:hypothetical protein [Kitasatospora xanthocidica]GHF76314.1 hypothetical protein GCM10018790_62830 [Kitasatospora xanthocidica]